MPRKKVRKAGQLPSGKFRCQVRYKDKDGVSHTKSFTGATDYEAKLKAAAWKADKRMSSVPTVLSRVNDYIDAKEAVLSPSTIRNYRGMADKYFDQIGQIRIDQLTNEDIQRWVSGLTMVNTSNATIRTKKLSPKTVSNIYGLLEPALEMFRPDFKVNISLPAKQRYRGHTPSDNEISALVEYLKRTQKDELLAAVYLGAFGPFRRAEICALTPGDINGNRITIDKDKVKNHDNEWIVKPVPKTFSSNRTVEVPPFVVEQLTKLPVNDKGEFFSCTPDALGLRFVRAIKYSKSKKFRFHDLRHYCASILHAIGVPDEYIIKRGGWKTDQVMKEIYRDTIDDIEKEQTAAIVDHFENMV